MSSKVIGRVVALSVVAALLLIVASASSASPARLRGVVVHDNRRAHSFVLALGAGKLVAVHTRTLPGVGSTIAVTATLLRNGTYAGRASLLGHRVRSARIHGVVTFVDRHKWLFTVSGDGASLLVRRSQRAGAAAVGSAIGLPAVGEDVTVSVRIASQGDLQDDGVVTTATQSSGMGLEGTILAVDTAARTLTVSADDEDQSGQSVRIAVPPTIDITMFSMNQEVKLTVTQQLDGSFLLQSASGDDNQQQANSQNDQEGCQQGDGQNSGQQGDGGDSGKQRSTSSTGTTGTTGATGTTATICASDSHGGSGGDGGGDPGGSGGGSGD